MAPTDTPDIHERMSALHTFLCALGDNVGDPHSMCEKKLRRNEGLLRAAIQGIVCNKQVFGDLARQPKKWDG